MKGLAAGAIGGSSPHTRGALDDFVGLVGELGIIPAYAGSTGTQAWRGSLFRDHPRIRGEHDSGEGIPAAQVGSSPHTRGALRVVRVRQGFGRDHPRIRGEHAVVRLERQSAIGSSPHTRGAPVPWRSIAAGSRIIPAYAGSTAPWWSS